MKALFSFALVLGVFFTVPALAQEDVDLVIAQQKYEQCVERSFIEPALSYIDAVTWRNEGGGLPASHCVAMSLANQGSYKEAAEEFEAMASQMQNGQGWSFSGEINSDNSGLLAEIYDQAGNVWLLAGDAIKAAETFTFGLDVAKPQTQTRLNLLIDRARAYAEFDNFEGALSDLLLAEEIAAQSAELNVLKASALRKLQRYEEASAALAKALQIEPENGEAYLERGILRFEVGNNPGARADWQTYLDLYPDGPGAAYIRENLAALETSGQTFDE